MNLVQQKVEQATQILNELDVDVWLTFVRESSLNNDPILDFIAANVTWQSALILTKQGEHTAIVGRYDVPPIEQLGAYQHIIGYDESIREALRDTLSKLNPRSIAINFSEDDVAADGLTLGMYRVLLRHLQGTGLEGRLVSAEKIIAAVRGRKSPTEIELVQQAVNTTLQLFAEVEQFVRVGMTQRQIFNFVQSRIAEMGLGYAWEQAANPIVTCGPHSPIGHAPPGDIPLEKGHLLHMDLGVKQDEYCSDLQRMWYVLDDGETTAPPDVQHAFQTVRGAIEAGRAALRAGVPGWQVDEVAREFIVDNGYAEFMHGFGHLLGRYAHDGATVLGPRWPKYAGICELPVEVDNIFTLELHVIVPNRGVMSLEEDVLVTENGAEYLSKPQTELHYLQAG